MRASQLLRFVAIATITAVIVAAIPSMARAQTITACSANKSGSMYRVGTTGTPSDCTNATHKKETWNVQGPPGTPGMSGYEVVKSSTTIAPAKSLGLSANCPTGKSVIGGGYEFSGSPDRRVWMSQPAAFNGAYISWLVMVENVSTVYPLSLTTYAICVKVAP